MGGRGFSVDYQSIIMHGVSRAGTAPDDNQPSVYMQFNLHDSILDSNGDPVQINFDSEGQEGQEGEGDGDLVAEMKIFPDPAAGDCVDDLFLALTECVALHPHSSAENSSDNDSAEDFTDQRTADDSMRVLLI